MEVIPNFLCVRDMTRCASARPGTGGAVGGEDAPNTVRRRGGKGRIRARAQARRRQGVHPVTCCGILRILQELRGTRGCIPAAGFRMTSYASGSGNEIAPRARSSGI